ncbi:hypothetical protein CFBP4215_03579 [Pseudomonas syringae pv. syringae]|nr:hypothetical protein CFBP4215_03579 [Pseudomonas syringae pv. syringae]
MLDHSVLRATTVLYLDGYSPDFVSKKRQHVQ